MLNKEPVTLHCLSLLNELPGIDAHDGLNRINNSIRSYQRVLCSFALTGEQYKHDLEQAIATENITQFRHHVHKLLGVSANLGANTLAGCCVNFLENTPASADKIPEASAREILNTLNIVMRGLSAFCEKSGE